MKLMASAGLAFDKVHLSYLANGKLRIRHVQREAGDKVNWQIIRDRPNPSRIGSSALAWSEILWPFARIAALRFQTLRASVKTVEHRWGTPAQDRA